MSVAPSPTLRIVNLSARATHTRYTVGCEIGIISLCFNASRGCGFVSLPLRRCYGSISLRAICQAGNENSPNYIRQRPGSVRRPRPHAAPTSRYLHAAARLGSETHSRRSRGGGAEGMTQVVKVHVVDPRVFGCVAMPGA